MHVEVDLSKSLITTSILFMTKPILKYNASIQFRDNGTFLQKWIGCDVIVLLWKVQAFCTFLVDASAIWTLISNSLSFLECFDVDTSRRYTLCSSRIDFDSNQKGILGACLCSTLPNVAAHLGAFWDHVAEKFDLVVPDASQDLPRTSTGTHVVSAFKKLYYNTYMQACESFEGLGTELCTPLLQGITAVTVSKTWDVHRLSEIDPNPRNAEKLASILVPLIKESYKRLYEKFTSESTLT